MKRKLLKSIALGTLLGVVGVHARELRTPIQFLQPGYLYYPSQFIQYYESTESWCFNWQAFGGAFTRDAQDAFGPCNSTCKVPYAQLIFGQSTFDIANAYPNNGTGFDFSSNPLAALTTLSPQFEYNEKSAVFGFEVDTNFEVCDSCCLGSWLSGEYYVRLRGRLPVRDIVVQDVCSTAIAASSGTTLEDVYQVRLETIGDNSIIPNDQEQTNSVFAIRLDFLSQLNRVNLPAQPMIVYSDPTTTPAGRVTIAGQEVDTFPITAADIITGIPPVAVISSPTGVVPVGQRWGDQVVPTTNPNGTPTEGITGVLAADGSGMTPPQRDQFSQAVSYTPLSTNVVNQSRLFVVPTLQGGSSVNANKLSQGALTIGAAIAAAVGSLPTFPDFLALANLNFCDGRTKGLGDFDLDLYLGREWGCEKQFWTELGLGVRFPTAKKLCTCLNVLQQPLGNNGHFEVRGEFLGGWDACETVKFMADFSISKVLKHNESVAAPFTGATVKNLGPCISAGIDWWYLMAHIDATFFACDWCGFDLGYEIYHKAQDNVKLCTTTAIPFGSTTAYPLNGCLLSQGTNVTSNKVRTGFFSNTDTCEIFAGWSYVFSGKNAPRETDFYFNMSVRF